MEQRPGKAAHGKAILELRPHDAPQCRVSAGLSIEGLLDPVSGDSFARYAASRSVALLITVLIAIAVRSHTAIAFLGIAMSSVQAFDGVIGALARDPSKTFGPFAFAVLNALAVAWLLRGREARASWSRSPNR